MADVIEEAVIRLGGVDHKVRAFTFKQLRDLLPRWPAAASGLSAEGGVDAAIDVIAAALDEPRELVEQMPATVPEIFRALEIVAQVSGLVPKEGDSGEPKAGE